MVGRFVIPTDDHGQDRCGGLARIIPLNERAEFLAAARVTLTTGDDSLVEVAHVLVLLGDGHCLEVMVIACGLEITTDQEEIYFVLLLGFQPLNVAVDCVKLAVAAALYGDLWVTDH
jgi:hypothetical protein